jgi:hypothetical protein
LGIRVIKEQRKEKYKGKGPTYHMTKDERHCNRLLI